jgi:mannose-6-phosphate isomerase-like protein (cupin superfamily)
MMGGSGHGWGVGTLEVMGDGPGFRKVRRALGVTAFGVNAIVLPPGIETGFHYHDDQDELYFVHRGRLEITFGDGTSQPLEEGSMAHVEAATHRRLRNTGDEDAIYLVVGARDGYVGRDAHVPEGDERVRSS